jgi:hypothetical protein
MPRLKATSSTRTLEQPLADGFVSDVELSPMLNIPTPTLRNWRLLGEGPEFLKFGKSVRYSLRAVQAWVEARPKGGGGVPSSALKSASRAKPPKGQKEEPSLASATPTGTDSL